MQNNNINVNQFFNRLQYAEFWEISDPIFKNIIARKTDFEKIEDAIDSLQNFAGQEVEIKAGNLDKNGNFTTQATKIKFFIPQATQNQSITIVGANQQAPQNETLTYSLNGTETPINPNNLTATLQGIEERLDAKYLKQSLEQEYFFKFQELDRREKEIRAKEKDLSNKIAEYDEKLNAVVPKTKDIANKVLDGFLFGFVKDEKKQTPLNNTPENKPIEFKIKTDDKPNFKEIFENLSIEEQDDFLNEYLETPEIEENKPEIATQTIKNI